MVLAALCEQYLPSHRGLIRNHQSLAAANDGLLWQQHHYQNSERTNSNTSTSQDNTKNSILLSSAATRPKRNRCKASKFLASCASDFDVLTDWLFYAHCRNSNAEHYEAEGVYQIPPWMVGLVLASCLVGTALWLVLATDGAVATPFLKALGYDKLSLGHLLLGSVVFEDLPQIVLTFFIEDYFEEDKVFNNYAVMNVVVSLYDILIKLAEAYDQRADIVETGHWCKESIPAHDQKIICLVPIPEESDEENNGSVGLAAVTTASTRDSVSTFPKDPVVGGSGGPSSLFRNKLHVSNQAQGGRRRSSRRTVFQEAQELIADTKLPPMRFLSASKDGNVKFWDTSANGIGGDRGRRPSETFVGHGRRVSCISLLRKAGAGENGHSRLEPPRDETKVGPERKAKAETETKPSYFFLTGSYDGTSKLWNTSKTQCLKTYQTPPFGDELASNIEVTSIAYIDVSGPDEGYTKKEPLSSFASRRSEYFVNGYKSGKVRLWDIWSGACLKMFEEKSSPSRTFFSAYRKKKSRIYSLCSMEDSRHFAAGSLDGSIKMWDVGKGISTSTNGHEEGTIGPIVEKDDPNFGETYTAKEYTTTAILATATPAQVFVGHTSTIFSVQCVSPGSVLLSGSEDTTAKLWSVSTGACLQTFFGHTGPIHDVAIVDQVTFLTASRDKTIRAWDAMSGEAFRTYENRSAAVTAVVTGDQSGCFLSGDENGTIGLWIFSAVHDEHERANLLGIDEEVMVCGGCQGDEELVSEEVNDAQGYTRIS